MMTDHYLYDDDQEFDIDKFLDEELKLTKKGTLRKRKPKEPRIYFTQDTENAILEYLQSQNHDIRNKIYNERISYAFYKLAENIIHTFKFYYTDTDTIEELKYEVVSFLLEKLHLYDQTKGAAFSYFGTIAKRYLINYNEKNYKKLQDKINMDDVDEENNILVDKSFEKTDINEFLDQYIAYFNKHMYDMFPKQKDCQTADAIVELFRRRESLEIFNKKALYIYIREITDVDTPQITKIIKKLKDLYTELYNEYYRNGFIQI
jgi:hypothetical protein